MSGGSIFHLTEIMGDHDHKPPLCSSGQQFNDLFAVLCVQVACRLVCHQHRGRLCQCPGNGQTLFLATGELGCPLVPLVIQIHLPENIFCPFCGLISGDPGEDQGAGYIFQHGASWQDIVTLGDEAHSITAVLFPV